MSYSAPIVVHNLDLESDFHLDSAAGSAHLSPFAVVDFDSKLDSVSGLEPQALVSLLQPVTSASTSNNFSAWKSGVRLPSTELLRDALF